MADKTFEANIYTPDWTFIAVLKDYISIVWTDRYYEEGDFELVLPLTKENLLIYAQNNYIICNQSDKVMIIEKIVTSTSAEGYKMKVTGRSAESLLRRRITANELIISRNTINAADAPIVDRNSGIVYHSHFAGALATAFDKCFNETTVEMMTEQNSDNAVVGTSEDRGMPIIRFSGIISDPFNHIADAIGNINSYGDEYYEIIQTMCEAKDIGFAVFRNFGKEIDRGSSKTSQINTSGLFDLVLYDGWNRTGSYLKNNGADMNVTMHNKLYQIPSGIIFSVEYFNLQSSDAQYSIEDYKNYIYVRGDEIKSASNASVDIGEKTANFTEAYTDEDAKYYLTGTYLNDKVKEYGIFRRETFTNPGISRGLNTRKKYADRLRARGYKVLKDLIPKVTLSCEITNVNDYIYREDYYLGDLVRVKDSMNNFGTFRVTEEIISSDSSGLKIYPTLEVYNEDKYVKDDSIDAGDESYYMVKVNWLFNGGKMPATKETAEMIYNIGSRFYNFNEITKSWETPIYMEYGNGAIKGIDEEDGTIIDTIPPINQITKGKTFNADNYQKFADELLGVVTCQETEDFIAFPSELGTVNTNPDDLGEYEIEKEHYDLLYWESSRRFEPHDDSLGPESGIVTYSNGIETFKAQWFPKSYRITFNHGEGGHFNEYFSFYNSYCHINEYSEYASQAPTFVYGHFYERKRSMYNNTYTYVLLQSRPANWSDTSGGPGSYKNYYMKTSPTVLDKVIKDVPYNTTPYPPDVYPDKDHKADNPLWTPEIVRATQDATYTAQWKEEGAEDEEDEDDEEDWDKGDDEDHVNSPVKNHQGKIEHDVFIGDEDSETLKTGGIGMACFRHLNSRVFDERKLVNGEYKRIADAADQHSAFYYTRDLGNNMTLNVFWSGAFVYGGSTPFTGSTGVGICISRNGDTGIIWANSWLMNARNTAGNYAANGDKIGEVAFTIAPAIKKIIGYKMLTYNPVSEDAESWPQNKIYRPVYNRGWTFTPINEKPSDWDQDDGYLNYCIKTQVGGRYGFTCQSYDDLGILFSPLWVRLGIVDHPIIPFATSVENYQLNYTSNALQIANYKTTYYGDDHVIEGNYRTSGWKWDDVPDGRWYGYKYNHYNDYSVTSDSKFFCTWTLDGSWGAMYEYYDSQSGTWKDLIKYPKSDWGDSSKYRYKVSSTYQTIGMYTGYSASLYGPPALANGGSASHMPAYYSGISMAGIKLPLPKLSQDENSLAVTITGYTQSQHVKPGEIATFKVNATSIVLTAELTYQWQMKGPGESEWTNVSSSGSIYAFTATSEQNGSELQCIVTATYSLFSDTITGSEITGIMSLTVNNEGTDGKKPSDYEKETEEQKGDTEKPQDVEPDQPQSSGGGSSSGSGSKKSLDVYGCGWFLGLPDDAYKDYGNYHFEYIGGGDPDDPPWVDNSGVIHNTPGWEVKGSDNGSTSNGTNPASKPSESGKGPVKKTQDPAELDPQKILEDAQKAGVNDIKSGVVWVTSEDDPVDLQKGMYNYSKSTENKVNETVAQIGGEGALSRQ